MSERPYIQHGRRHGPKGSDPIIGLGLPWGYARYTADASFSSSTSSTYIDFDVGVGGFGGITSGDPDITFGDNGSGRKSLIINETGLYAVGVGVYCKLTAAPAAGTCVWLDPTWRDQLVPKGHGPAQPFVLQPGGTDYIADTSTLWMIPLDGTTLTVPSVGDVAVTQNSTQTATIEVWEFAVKISATVSPFF